MPAIHCRTCKTVMNMARSAGSYLVELAKKPFKKKPNDETKKDQEQ